MPLSNLNEEQYAAATAHKGKNLIIASAGTGKTSTIVGRIAYLLHNGINPEQILLLTFTNKAAAEMVERVAAFFGKETAGKIKAGTFHAVSYKWLRELGDNIMLKQPSEIKTLFRSVYEKRQFHHLDAGKALSPAYLYDQYSLFQNDAVEDFGKWLTEKNPDHEPFVEIYQDIIDEFEVLKDSLGFVSFNDLLIKMRTKLQEGLESPFKEVLVDEFQDTNPLQNSLIEALHPDSLFCVGDYDQSIYAFNGAKIEIIAGFADRYYGSKVFSLDKNYRSSAPILSLANRVISNNERIYPKKLQVVKTGEFPPPRLLAYDELYLQYEGIAKQIANSKNPKSEIAVIFRNNASADGIEAMLREFNIPAKRRGSSSLFDTVEIKALLDIFTLFLNPKDLLAFIHVFEFGQGIGTATARELHAGLRKLGEGNPMWGLISPKMGVEPFERQAKNYQLGLFEEYQPAALLKARFKEMPLDKKFLDHPMLEHPKLTHEGVRYIEKFYKMVIHKPNTASPQTLINYIVKSDIFAYIADKLATKRATRKDKTIDEKAKAEANDRIFAKGDLIKQLAGHYQDSHRFINAMVLGSGEMSEGEGVNLLSVHASKGLEFEEVYVIDLMDGRFPNHKLMNQGGSLDEERRLFYVAVTRAKSQLALSYAKFNKAKKTDYVPSPFLVEAGMVQKIEL